jgi:hypothetical protein
VVGSGVLLGALLLPAANVLAAPADARVDAVQAPAWVEHAGRNSEPLAPGMVLGKRDRIVTGADARVLIRMVDGSAVKLGENALVDVNAFGRRDARTLTAVFDVARGAFRFTSGVFPGAIDKRAVNVRVSSIIAGIRGTDLWGSADAERDLVCLLDGGVGLFHELDSARRLDSPNSVYEARKGEVPQAVEVADRDQVAQWLEETELQVGNGVTRQGGRWQVELDTLDDEASVLELYDRARSAGYAVRILPTGAAGGWRYALRVRQLPTHADAVALAEKLQRDLDLAAPRVLR